MNNLHMNTQGVHSDDAINKSLNGLQGHFCGKSMIWRQLTLGSNLRVEAVRKAALPSLRTTAKPPTSGEYSKSTTWTPGASRGTAVAQDYNTSDSLTQ